MTRPGTVIVAVVLLCVAGLAGCGADHDTASGSVVGDYRISGGPAPGIDEPVRGTIWAYRGTVSLDRMSALTPTAHAPTGSDGRFDLALPVGEFTLLGSQGTDPSTGGCGSPLVVDVTATSTQTVHLVCSIP